MNHSKFLQGLGLVLAIVVVMGCSLFGTTPQSPVQPGQQPQQPGQPVPQPGQSPQPGAPGPNGGGPAPSGMAQVDQTVIVPGNGGFAEVKFRASKGQRIQISLSSSNPAMQPYGSLQFPDGSSVDNPPLNTAANGANEVALTLNQDGEYSLTVFDGLNQGGPVSVKITPIP